MTTRDLLLLEARLENLSDEFLERVSALISSKMVWLGGERPNDSMQRTALRAAADARR